MIKNNYGNYVVQKALKISMNESKVKLIFNILNDIDKVKDWKLNLKWKNIILNNLPSADEIDKEEMEKIVYLIYGKNNNNNIPERTIFN